MAQEVTYQLETKHFQSLSAKDTTHEHVAILAEMMAGLKVGMEYDAKLGVWRVGVKAYSVKDKSNKVSYANSTLGYQAGVAVGEETTLYPALKKSMLKQVLSAAHIAFEKLLMTGPVTYFYSAAQTSLEGAPEMVTKTVTKEQANPLMFDIDVTGPPAGSDVHAKMSKAFAELMAKKLDKQFSYDLNPFVGSGDETAEEDKKPHHQMFVHMVGPPSKIKIGPKKKKVGAVKKLADAVPQVKAAASKKETVQGSQGGHMNMIAEMVNKAPVNLRDATGLYQPVHGTSPGSVYHVVGLTTEGVKVAARYKGQGTNGLSIRVDGPNMKQYQSLLMEIGLSVPSDGESATHWSMHVSVEHPWLASRTVGSILGHLARKLNFTTPVPQFEEVYKHGC